MTGQGVLCPVNLLRVLKDYYKNTPHRMTYKKALADSRMQVCYNGDIFSAEDYRDIMSGDKNALYKMKEIWVYMGKYLPIRNGI